MDNRLYSHVVDMALNGSMGDFALVNQELDNTNSDYSGQLLAIEDEASGEIRLLATRLSGNSLHLVKFDITNELSGALIPTELLTINNSYGLSNMRLSPDGKKLLLYHFTAEGALGVKPAELLVYNMTRDYNMAGVNGEAYTGDVAAVPVINRVTIPEGTIAGSGADFTSTGSMVVYSQVTATGEAISKADLTSNVSTTLIADARGDISLRSDGKVYISLTGSNELLAYESDLETNYTLPITTALSGYMANKVYRSEATENVTEHLFAKRTGLKQYELKDHLGNVRSVVSDLKTATGQGATPANDANVLAYYNYYPFGMRMPGRYTPANLVGQGGYRYGFNGKEKDDDMSGSTGAVYDYGARDYDSRISRWLAVDILNAKYPSLSPYSFSNNNPVIYKDINGKDWYITTTFDNNGNKTIHMKLTVAILNASSNKNIDMNLLKSQAEQQIINSYSIKYQEASDYERVNLYSGLDRPANNVLVPSKLRNVSVEVEVESRIINNYTELKDNEHLLRVMDKNFFRSPENTMGQVNEIGGKLVNINLKYIGGVQTGLYSMIIPHEFGHTLGLRHIDRKYETGVESFFKITNPDYKEDYKYYPKNLMNSTYDNGTFKLDSWQINKAAENIDKGKINKKIN